MANGGSQARGQIGAAAAGLLHSHSNMGSELRLWPTPQPTVMPDPWPTEQGQGSNPRPHGCQLGSLTTEPRWELQESRYIFELLKGRNSSGEQSLDSNSQTSWQLEYFKGLSLNFRIKGLFLWGSLGPSEKDSNLLQVGWREGVWDPVLQALSFDFILCFPSRTVPLTLCWFLFLHVKRLLRLLSPEYVSLFSYGKRQGVVIYSMR